MTLIAVGIKGWNMMGHRGSDNKIFFFNSGNSMKSEKIIVRIKLHKGTSKVNSLGYYGVKTN